MIINLYDSRIGKAKGFLENKYPKTFEQYIMPGCISVYDKLMLFKSRKRAKSFLTKVNVPLFKTIEIETINRCNGSCSFCPVNKFSDPRPFKMMDENLFLSIIKQLVDINYRGSIALYSNNEPLLDKRILDLLQIVKEYLPNNCLYLFTNGKLLTNEKLDELMTYVDKLIIDNYNDNLLLNNEVNAAYNYAVDKSYKERITIYLRKENEILLNRSGQANNRSKNIFKLKSACAYPFEQMVVRPNGEVSLCCNDATGKMTLGNLNNDNILDVWNGHKYNMVRRNLTNNRALNPLCANCDVVLTEVAY